MEGKILFKKDNENKRMRGGNRQDMNLIHIDINKLIKINLPN